MILRRFDLDAVLGIQNSFKLILRQSELCQVYASIVPSIPINIIELSWVVLYFLHSAKKKLDKYILFRLRLFMAQLFL